MILIDNIFNQLIKIETIEQLKISRDDLASNSCFSVRMCNLCVNKIEMAIRCAIIMAH